MKIRKKVHLAMFLSIFLIIAVLHFQFVTADKRNFNIKRIGKFDDGGRYLGIQLREPFVYAVDGEQGLEIINITNRENSFLVGKFNPYAGIPQDVFINGSYAFLANSFDGIRIINITDPTKATNISQFLEVEIQYIPFYQEKAKSDSINIYVKGTIAYIADGKFGIRILNLTDILNPIKIGEYPPAEAKNPGVTSAIVVNDSYAYVADGDNGIEILDISDFKNITRIGHYDDGGKARDLSLVDSFLYVADSDDGFEILDVSDPTNPVEIGGFYDGSGLANSVYIDGDRAFIADNTDGLEVFDISDPTSPVEIGQFYEETGIIGLAQEVVVNGSYIYVAFGTQGVEILIFGTPESVIPILPLTFLAVIALGIIIWIIRGGKAY
ncbi:MAG: LVIVD repeat-containing protein [Promethearchaeota archaeon]